MDIESARMALLALGGALFFICIFWLKAYRQLREQRAEALALQDTIAGLSADLDQSRAEKAMLGRRLDEASLAAEESRLLAQEQEAELKADLAQVRREREQLSLRAAQLEAQEAGLRDRLAAEQSAHTGAAGKLETLRADLHRAELDYSRLQTQSAADLRAAREQIALLGDLKAQMEARFKELAEQSLRDTGEALSNQNRDRLEALLSPLKDHVGRFETELRSVHTDAAREREALKAEMRQLTQRSEAISREAVNLTRALKGDKQRQGAWGEMILSSLLERSGLRLGHEYRMQETFKGEEGQRLRPDVIVNLPGSKALIIDSKVSLNAYERAVNTEDEAEREAAIAAHVRAVRAHIDTLSGKSYDKVAGSAVDYVIMFLPIEGALSEALRAQGDLTAYALERNVSIATPTTLMMALRTIEQVWAVEKRSQNAEDIAARAGSLYDKLAGFVDEMKKVGERLAQAQDAHDRAFDRLSRGRGSVLRQAEMLKELGAKTSKALAAPTEEAAPAALPLGEVGAAEAGSAGEGGAD